MTYILILTIAMISNGRPAAAIQSIPGFGSKQECLTAANAWIAHAGRKNSHVETYEMSALCVQQSKP